MAARNVKLLLYESDAGQIQALIDASSMDMENEAFYLVAPLEPAGYPGGDFKDLLIDHMHVPLLKADEIG